MKSTPVVRAPWKTSLVAGALAVACSLALAFVFGVGGGVAFPGVSFAPLIALACIASVVATSTLARQSERGRWLRAASWSVAGWAPYLFGGAAFDLTNPIITGHWRCGTGDIGLFFLAACSVPVVFALTVLSGVQANRVSVPGVTRLFAWFAVGTSALAFAASMGRSHKLAREDYLASLPAVAEISRDGDSFMGPSFVVKEKTEESVPAAGQGSETGCVISSRGDGEDVRQLWGVCKGTRVLRDARHGLWILQAPTEVGGTIYSAISDRSKGVQAADVTVRDVASSLRPPTAWTVSLGLGSGLGLLLLGVASGTRKRAEEWRSARRGAHGGGGWVTFEDGTPPGHFAAAAALPEGPVLVIESSRKAANYREHGRMDEGARFATGSYEEIARAAEDRETDLSALATLAAVLTMAPMVAAAMNGLLG